MFETALLCLALNVYHESRDQPVHGMKAVAEVVLNRVVDRRFPDTVCEVVMQGPTYTWKPDFPVRHRCQFSWYCDGKPDVPLDSVTWLESIRVADMISSNKYIDITNGALYYHADYTTPYWSSHLERLVQIENHIFYK